MAAKMNIIVFFMYYSGLLIHNEKLASPIVGQSDDSLQSDTPDIECGLPVACRRQPGIGLMDI